MKMAKDAIQSWRCTKCGKSGKVEYDHHAGVWEVVGKIRDDHNDVSPIVLSTPIR